MITNELQWSTIYCILFDGVHKWSVRIHSYNHGGYSNITGMHFYDLMFNNSIQPQSPCNYWILDTSQYEPFVWKTMPNK